MSLRSMLRATWSTVGGWFGLSGYAATDPRDKTNNPAYRPQNATANQLSASLSGLRAQARDLERNNPTARAVIEGLVANIVGTGIALEPDTGDDTANAKIRAAWIEYLEDCTAGGRHDAYNLQDQACRELVTAGEFLWRLVVLPERIAAGKIPLCVLPLEAEWLDEQTNTVGMPDASGLVWVSGVGVDKYGRPQSYRIRNPETRGAQPETIAASEIVHGYEHRRALQARGEPWLSPVLNTLKQERDLVDAELTAAKTTASIALCITSEMHEGLDTTETGTTDDPNQVLRLGSTARLLPGEDAKAFAHTRPSQQIAPFRQMLRGDIAAATCTSQRFLDRDVSRANYSSMRADMLDSERLLSPKREWFGHATIGRLYKSALPYLSVRAGVKMPKPTYRLLPDGQPYVDPYKDVQAAAMAVASGMSNYETEASKRGKDYKKIWEQAAKEKAEAIALGLSFDLSGTNAPAPESQMGKEYEAKPKATGGFDE